MRMENTRYAFMTLSELIDYSGTVVSIAETSGRPLENELCAELVRRLEVLEKMLDEIRDITGEVK